MSLNKRMKTHLTQLKKKLHLKHSLNKDKKVRTESQLWTEQPQGDGARKVLQHCPTSSCLWAATDSSIAHRTYWIVLVKVFISFLLSSPVGPGHPHLVFCHNLLCQLVECHMHMGFHFLCALLCWCRALLTHPVPPNDAGLSVRHNTFKITWSICSFFINRNSCNELEVGSTERPSTEISPVVQKLTKQTKDLDE